MTCFKYFTFTLKQHNYTNNYLNQVYTKIEKIKFKKEGNVKYFMKL